MNDRLRYFLRLFLYFGPIFLILNILADAPYSDEEANWAVSIITGLATAALIAGLMLYFELRGLRRAGVEEPGWPELGGDYGEVLSLPLSWQEVRQVFEGHGTLMAKEEATGQQEFEILNRVYGHYGKHRTFLVLENTTSTGCSVRLENRSKNAWRLSDMGFSRKQYEEVRAALQREAARA